MVLFAAGLVVGLILGVILALVLLAMRRRSARAELRDAFSALAATALDANSKQLTERAETSLEGKKQLIEQAVKNINDRLAELNKYVKTVEGERKSEFGRLSGSVSSLATTTGDLHKMLASTQRRGAWGERMADDILRLAGLAEGVNYRKQSSEDAEQGRPDFTFMLPNDLVVNMDVKFPMANYKAYLDADSDSARTSSAAQLVKDVRGHVRDVAGRGYIKPDGGTVRYVLVFIPSEQIFSLVLETQPDLIDEALGRKVVMASPLTLYAMLAVIRQAAENANIMKTTDEVITLLGAFREQWINYNIELDKLGQQIEKTAGQFEIVSKRRTKALQRPLDKIDALRDNRSLPDEIDPA